MRKIIFILLIGISVLKVNAQESEITTYYFIRHAEKERTDKTNENPNLTENGQQRAENWSTVFKNVDFDLIYSTNYNRTIETATPTSESKSLEIKFYNPNELYNDDFKLTTKNKTVLVVGHSNTTPLFVNAILENEKYAEIEDLNNSNLYI
ncbi:histidine phosphatase family protein, partial [uncultured Lutibacter sp.]|uniref:SixA phosphatase family protein n=1 Tax=uncultured Lutibacter sp. TaxID=437739 RepID=UPI002602A556